MESWYVQDLEGETSLGGVAAYKRFNPAASDPTFKYEFELVEWKVGGDTGAADQIVGIASEISTSNLNILVRG